MTPSGTGRYQNTETHIVVSQKALDNLVWTVAKNLYSENVSNLTIEAAKLTSSIKVAQQKYNTSKEQRQHILSKIDVLEERIIEGKISTKKADELSQKYEDELRETEQAITDYAADAAHFSIQLRKLKTDNTTPDLDSLDFDNKLDIVHITVSDILLERIDNKTVKAEILTNFGFTLIYELYNYTGKFKLTGMIAIQ